VTTFKYDESADRSSWCTNILPTIEEHHGENGQPQPYSTIAVIGVTLTPDIQQEFEEFGFREFQVTAAGFEARRTI
jgi:hypothetical protein